MPAHIIAKRYGIEFGLGFIGHGSASGFTISAASKERDHVDVMGGLDQHYVRVGVAYQYGFIFFGSGTLVGRVKRILGALTASISRAIGVLTKRLIQSSLLGSSIYGTLF